MLKPKVGDVVRLKPLKVEMVSDSGCFSTTGAMTLFQWNEFDIEEILSRPLAVGDRVRFKESRSSFAYEILGLNDDECWIRPINATMARVSSITAKIEDLIRIDPS